MLTPLQIKKLTHFFNILDFDKNGSIEADDFEAIGENLAIIRDIDLDTPDYEVVMGMTNGIWDKASTVCRKWARYSAAVVAVYDCVA